MVQKQSQKQTVNINLTTEKKSKRKRKARGKGQPRTTTIQQFSTYSPNPPTIYSGYGQLLPNIQMPISNEIEQKNGQKLGQKPESNYNYEPRIFKESDVASTITESHAHEPLTLSNHDERQVSLHITPKDMGDEFSNNIPNNVIWRRTETPRPYKYGDGYEKERIHPNELTQQQLANKLKKKGYLGVNATKEDALEKYNELKSNDDSRTTIYKKRAQGSSNYILK